jgi:hypothetical protein
VTSAGGENFGGKRAEKKKLAAKSHRTRSRAKFESTFQKINKPLLARRERGEMNLLKSILGWSESATPKLQAEGTFYVEKTGTWTCLYVQTRLKIKKKYFN